jgi:hypothetical protein
VEVRSFIVSAMPANCPTDHISCFLLPAAHMSEILIILLFGVKHHVAENYFRFVDVCYVGRLAEGVWPSQLDRINADPKGNWY